MPLSPLPQRQKRELMLNIGRKALNFFRQKPTERENEEAVLLVKSINSKYQSGTNLTSECIKESLLKIKNIMKRHLCSASVQATCCHALSNMLIDQNPLLIHHTKNLRIQESLEKALVQHRLDDKVNWLACSAFWNLCRNQALRDQCGPKVSKRILIALETFKGNARVSSTALGALSNLSLHEGSKNYIHQNLSSEKICNITAQHLNTPELLATSLGLMTNLATSHRLILQSKQMSLLVNAIRQYPEDKLLIRNFTALLHNISQDDAQDPDNTSSHLSSALEYGVAEPLIEYCMQEPETDTLLTRNLLEKLGANDPAERPSSLILASDTTKLGKIPIVSRILQRRIATINSHDASLDTALHKAVRRSDLFMTEFLVCFGANAVLKNSAEETTIDLASDDDYDSSKVRVLSRVPQRESLYRISPKPSFELKNEKIRAIFKGMALKQSIRDRIQKGIWASAINHGLTQKGEINNISEIILDYTSPIDFISYVDRPDWGDPPEE